MRKKVSWTGWRKQLKQYVTSGGGGKVPAAVQVNGENVRKEENEVNDDMQHQVGDLGSTEPPSSCEDVKSDESQREEKLQSCIKADAEELGFSHLSPLTPPRPNSGSAPQISPPTPSRSNPGVASALKKGAFKHVYRSGPVRKLSSRTKTAANDAGAQRPAAAGVRTPGEQETMAATAIQAAFRGYRSRRNSSEDVWSEGAYSNKRLEKELAQTQASSTHMSQTDPHRDLSTTGADKNINGEWNTDTRSRADIEASEQFKQLAALKRERAREYALSLRRLKYGLEQKDAKTPPPADCTMLDKPDYVMNWLERAQGARDDHVLKIASDSRNLPSESLTPKIAIADGEKPKLFQNGEKEKPKSGDRMKPKNGEKEKPNSDQKGVAAAEARTPRGRNGDTSDRAFDTNEHLQDHSSLASVAYPTPPTQGGARRLSFSNGAGAHTGKGTGTLNERRKSVGSCASPAAPMVVP